MTSQCSLKRATNPYNLDQGLYIFTYKTAISNKQHCQKLQIKNQTIHKIQDLVYFHN